MFPRLPQPLKSITTRIRSTQDPLTLAAVPAAAGSASALRKTTRPSAHTVQKPTTAAVQTPAPTSLRLLKPVHDPVDDHHLRSCVERFTHTDWARE